MKKELLARCGHDMMLVVATGLAVLIGAVLGMLGGGGSVLMVPVLLYLVGLQPKTALATSQILLTVTSAVAVLVHIRARRVVWSTGVLFGAASMSGAYCGGRAARYVPAQLLLLGFTALMLLSAVQMLRGRQLALRRPPGSAPRANTYQDSGLSGRLAALGFLTGLLTGMLGVGGGFLIVPALSLFGGLPIEKAVGTSLFIISLQSLAGSVGYLGHVAVDVQLVAQLAAAMALGSIGGGLLSRRLPAALLRRLFAGLLLGVALLMLLRNL
ncbi:MAG TPA: sulfite exporter TauE/SafE family protein [Pseudomonadota bacterium]|nr:sulfite exporter TauE/SafE family protein [Pseudomonadota bacterium]